MKKNNSTEDKKLLNANTRKAIREAKEGIVEKISLKEFRNFFTHRE
jgi:hypothetical protein